MRNFSQNNEYQQVTLPRGMSQRNFFLNIIINKIRTWCLFHFKYKNVKYSGFARIMRGCYFHNAFKVELGHHVQFGKDCRIESNLKVGNYFLAAGQVCFVGAKDHTYDKIGQYIWNSKFENDEYTIINDDVWIGYNATIVGPIQIGAGSIIAAGSVLTKNVPTCEIWGGVPAKKIRDRFTTVEDTQKHLKIIGMKYTSEVHKM